VTGARFHSEDVGLLVLIAQQIGVSLENLRLLSDNLRKRLLEEELQLAAEIQKQLLPTIFPAERGYATHALSLASKEVGGDYFDLFLARDGRLHLAIADVSGKGMPAALIMASLRAALRSSVQHLDSPARVLEHINDLLYESTSLEKFATFFFGTLDMQTHELVYANAGHNYPVVVRANGQVGELAEGGLVLGIVPGTGYEDGKTCLGPGDVLFLYTDGITEAMDSLEEEFGVERLHGHLRDNVHCGASEIVDGVLRKVREFVRGSELGDDVTMLVVRRAVEAAS